MEPTLGKRKGFSSSRLAEKGQSRSNPLTPAPLRLERPSLTYPSRPVRPERPANPTEEWVNEHSLCIILECSFHCTMWLTLRCIFLYLCVINVMLSVVYESEDVVPVRINGRGRGRFWKRSEEQPRFTLSAFGEEFTLNLTPDASFIAPSFTIQRVTAKHVEVLPSAPGAQRQDVPQDSVHQLRGCFYSGNVDYNQDSVVAVSLCNGIFGSFINEGKEYVIEPKQLGSLGVGAIEQLHVIKRRIHNNTVHSGYPLSPGHHAEESPAEWDELFTRGLRDAQRKPRQKRFVSEPRFIETLVVADASMTQFYGDEIKVGNNIAQHVFHQPSPFQLQIITMIPYYDTNDRIPIVGVAIPSCFLRKMRLCSVYFRATIEVMVPKCQKCCSTCFKTWSLFGLQPTYTSLQP